MSGGEHIRFLLNRADVLATLFLSVAWEITAHISQKVSGCDPVTGKPISVQEPIMIDYRTPEMRGRARDRATTEYEGLISDLNERLAEGSTDHEDVKIILDALMEAYQEFTEYLKDGIWPDPDAPRNDYSDIPRL